MEFRKQCLALFELVEARQPEKGIQTLIKRAKRLTETNNIAYQTALLQIYDEAKNRTEARLRLLNQCQLNGM